MILVLFQFVVFAILIKQEVENSFADERRIMMEELEREREEQRRREARRERALGEQSRRLEEALEELSGRTQRKFSFFSTLTFYLTSHSCL